MNDSKAATDSSLVKKRNSAAAKRKKLLINICLITVCLITVCLIFGKLFFGGFSLFIINSSSMGKEYPVNSIVAVNRGEFSDLKAGDAIVYKSDALNGKPAFHRVTRVTEDGVYTKGDNNNFEDNQLITPETYVGKELFKITFIAGYLSLLQTVTGFILFLVLPILAVIITVLSITLLKKSIKSHEKDNSNNQNNN